MCRIILAEDDEVTANLVVNTLMDAGHAVGHFPDGMQALMAMRFRTPDLVILDCVMPELGGIDTLRMMRQDTQLCDLPVMMLTARTSPADEEIARYEGAHAYLPKPCDLDMLVIEAETLIEKFRVREARQTFTHFGRNGLTMSNSPRRPI